MAIQQLEQSCKIFEGFCFKWRWRDFTIQTSHSCWILWWGARFFRQLSIWALILRHCYHSTHCLNEVCICHSFHFVIQIILLIIIPSSNIFIIILSEIDRLVIDTYPIPLYSLLSPLPLMKDRNCTLVYQNTEMKCMISCSNRMEGRRV